MNWFSKHFHIDLSEISTKLGAILGALVAGADHFGAMKPELAYVGLAATALLVLIKDKPDA